MSHFVLAFLHVSRDTSSVAPPTGSPSPREPRSNPAMEPTAMYVRTIRVPSSNGTTNEYVRVVEAYRENGKVKQRTIADLGRKDLLLALLPQLERVLKGTPKLEEEPEGDIAILHADTWGPVLVVRTLFDELGLWQILDGVAAKAR